MSRPVFLRGVALLAPLLAFAACGGGEPDDLEATTEDVAEASEDMETMAATEEEIAAFRAPADSVLSEEQVEAYLRTSLLQFDYIRDEAADLHARGQEIEERAEGGGALSQLRNLAAGVGLMTDFANIIGGSFVRSARTQGYNPAEMEWVRERMAEVSVYLMARPMMEMGAQAARQMREQGERLRAQLEEGQTVGFTREQVDEMIANAEQMEAEAVANSGAQGAALRNMEVLREIRPAVTDPMWSTIGIASGTMGLGAMSGLGDPDDPEAQAKLDEFRRVYTDALENRVSPGMENSAGTPPGN